MPVYLNVKYPGPERRAGLNWPRLDSRALDDSHRPLLHIGLVNNIGDAAMSQTEDQFLSLIEAAAGEMAISITLYSLPEVERKAYGQRRVSSFYWSIDRLWSQPLEYSPDGLIVTGREPVASSLREETYWRRLETLLEWTQIHGRSAVWSCLAAHAAVLALDGVERIRSPKKHFGVFPCERAVHHPLLDGVTDPIQIPHSRWNGLSVDRLVARGYEILTLTSEGCVDTFVKQDAGLFVFFQGHPEYESSTLLSEYRRDVGRYLRGEIENYPDMPRHYFTPDIDRKLNEIRSQALAHGGETVVNDVSTVLDHLQIENRWRPTAVAIYRNWLTHLWAEKCQNERQSRARSAWNVPLTLDQSVSKSN